MRHGHLTVVKETERDSRSIRRYECVCDCGKVVVLRSNHFYPTRLFCSRQCSFLSCKRTLNLTGKKFHRWFVLGIAKTKKESWWHCKCDCGTERTLRGWMLTGGESKSCGCYLRDIKSTGRTPEQEMAVRRERCRLSARKNPARVKANKIKYEAKLDRATPKWLTESDWASMNRIYEEARRLTRKTGVKHQVDHIIPVNGDNISGLHVPTNLQILTQSENVAKSNRYAELSGD